MSAIVQASPIEKLSREPLEIPPLVADHVMKRPVQEVARACLLSGRRKFEK
jgi:hypothetical protein